MALGLAMKGSKIGLDTCWYYCQHLMSGEETIEGDVAMKKEQLDLVRGSGNIYRDFNVADADVRQLKAILAAEIIKTLDRDELSVRKAQALTGIDA